MRGCTSIVAGMLLAATLGTPHGAALAAEEPGVFGFQWENDAFQFGDDHYTNGLRFAYVPRTNQLAWLHTQARKLAAVDRHMQALEERFFPGSGRARTASDNPSPDRSRVTLLLGQSMFTPNKMLRDETGYAAIAADRPYAGWLYGGLALHRPFNDNHGLTTVEFDVGVVGPKSFAADVQTWWHNVNGWAPFLGWEHQIPTEPTLQLSFRRSQILTQLATAAAPAPLGLTSDVLWDYGFSLGSPHTMAAANMRIRVGLDLPNDFGPARIRPAISGYDVFETGLRHAYAFVGVGAQATLYDAFLDGTLFHDSPRVSKRPGVVEAQLGVVVPLKVVRVGATVVRRSREFDGPWGEVEEFWSLSFSLLCAAQPKVACY